MYKSPDGWSLYSENWSVKTMSNKVQKKKIYFSWDKQRGFVWSKAKSSLFIHSILWGMLDNSEPFKFTKHNNTYYCMDGQQRGTTILKFISDEFALTGLKNQFPIYVDGKPYEINGKHFSQLPEELKDKIMDFTISVTCLEGAPPDVEAEFFARFNNGDKVSKVDVAVCKNENSVSIDEIGEHEIFTVMFSKGYLDGKKQRAEVAKTWIALKEDDKKYTGTYITKLISTLNITEDDKNFIFGVYNFILEAYKIVDIKNNSLSKVMMNRLNFFAYLPCWELFETPNQMADWIIHFYSDPPEEYVNASEGHTTNTDKVAARLAIVRKSIENFIELK